MDFYNNKVETMVGNSPDIELLNTIIREMNIVINQILNSDPDNKIRETLVNMVKSLRKCRNNLISSQQGRIALIDQCYNDSNLVSKVRSWKMPMTPLCEKIVMCQTIINTTINMLNFIKMYIYDPIFTNTTSNLDNAECALERIDDLYKSITIVQASNRKISLTNFETTNRKKYAKFIKRILVDPKGYCISEDRLKNIEVFFGKIQREIHIFKDKNYGNDDEDEEEIILTSLATVLVDLIDSNMIGRGSQSYDIIGTDTDYQLSIPDIEDIPQYCYDEELFTQDILLSLALLSSRTNDINLRTYILNLLDMYWMVRFDQMEDWYLMMLTDCKLKNKMLSTYCNTLNRFISNSVAVRDPSFRDLFQRTQAIISDQGRGQRYVFTTSSSGRSSSRRGSSGWSASGRGGGRKQMRGGISSASGSKACNDSPSISVSTTDNTFEDDVTSLLTANDILFIAFLLASLTKTQDELSHDFLPYLKKLVYTLISSNYKPVIDAFAAKLDKLITDNPGNAEQATIIKNFIQDLRSNTAVPETEWNYYSSILKFLDNRCKKIDSVNIVMIANVKKYPFLSRLQDYGYFWQFEKDTTKPSSDDDDDNSSYFYKYLDGSMVTIGGGKFSDAHLVYFADNSTSTRKLIPIYKNQNIDGNVSVRDQINYVRSASVIRFENSSYVFYYGPGLLDPANQNPIPKTKFFGDLANQVIDRIQIVPPDVKMAGGGNVNLEEYIQIIKDIQRDQDINLPESVYARIFMIDGINKFIAMFGVVAGFVDISAPESIRFLEDGDSYSGITFTLTAIPATATATAVPACNIELKTGKGKVVKSDTTIDNVSDFIIWLESSTESPKLDRFLSEVCPADILVAQWQSWRRLYIFANAIFQRIPSNVKTAILTQMGLRNNLDGNAILKRRMITEIIITLKSFGDSYQVDYVKKISEYLKKKYNLSVSIRSTDKNVGGEGLLISCPFWLIGTGIRPHYDFYTKYATFFGNREFKETVDVEDGTGNSSKVTIGLKPGCVEYNTISTITTDSSLVDIPSIISEITSYSKSIVELPKLAPALSFASFSSSSSASTFSSAFYSPPPPVDSTSGMEVDTTVVSPPTLAPPTKWPPIPIDESKLPEQIKLFKAMIVHFTAATITIAAAAAAANAANILTAELQSQVLTAVASIVATNIVTDLCIMSMANSCLEAGINTAAMGNAFGQSINRIVSAGGGGIGGGSKNLNKINQIGGAAFIIDEKTTINGLSNLLTKISTINDLLKIVNSKETIKGEINVFGKLALEKIKRLEKILITWDIRGKTQTIQSTADEIKTGFKNTNPLTDYITLFAHDNIIETYVSELDKINQEYESELNQHIDNFKVFMMEVEKVEEPKGCRSSVRDRSASEKNAKENQMVLLMQDYDAKQKNESATKFKELKNKLELSFEKVQEEWQRKVNANKKITEKQKVSFENAQRKFEKDSQKYQQQEQQHRQQREQAAKNYAEAKMKENDPSTVRLFGLELIQSTNEFIKQLYDQCKKISNITMLRSNKIQPSTDRGGGAKTQRRYKKKHVTRKKQLNKRHKRLSRKQLKKGQKPKPVRFSKKIRRHHY